MNLSNLLKYCLGYLRLTNRRSYIIQDKYAVFLDVDYFDLSDFLAEDASNIGSTSYLVNLKTFYSLKPKELTIDNEHQYNKEKNVAEKLEDIYNKHKNDEFTKQINLNFGFYEIEIPDIDTEISEETDEIEQNNDLFSSEHIVKKTSKTQNHPLFSIPIIITRKDGKYYLSPADSEIQTNISLLEPVIGEDRFLQIAEAFGMYETEEEMNLPIINNDIFAEMWNKVCEQLKLTNVVFGESSFKWNKVCITLSPKVNYFLVEDLQKLSRLADDELQKTSLISWVSDTDLSNMNTPPEEGELYFPFPYDKYQLKVLGLTNNKASVIQGPPGTGKSQTIANILCHLAANNKKVLFVSQKAQALKVVKDKLNELKVNGKKLQYLYGYIPNLSSPQIGESDELDGIAPQLAAFGQYYASLEYSKKNNININEDLSSLLSLKKSYCDTFNNVIDQQHLFYKLFKELNNLDEFAVPISNISCFKNNFNSDAKKILVDILTKVANLKNIISAYENKGIANNYGDKFTLLNLESQK